jgi:hypothetical protein
MNLRSLGVVLIALAANLGIPVIAARAGLIAYYPFDGNSTDASGNGLDGTVHGATFDADGFRGSALRCDGVNDSVSVLLDINASQLPQLTMGAWVNTNTPSVWASRGRAVISGDNGHYDRHIGFDIRGGAGTPPDWMTFTGNGVFASGVDVVTDTWVFLAAVYDQTTQTARLYVNDQVFTTTTDFGTGVNYVRIGCNPAFGEYFDGRIDDVFFFNEALSDQQVAQIRINGIPEPSTLALLALAAVGLLACARRRQRTRCARSAVSAASCLLAAAIVVAPSVPVRGASTSFDAGSEGWEIVGLDGGYPLPAYGGTTPAWLPAAGNPDGTIYTDDQYAETFFSAPAEFLGSQPWLLGTELSYDIKISFSDNAAYPAVVLEGSDRGLYYVLPSPPLDTWCHVTVPFTFGNWTLNSWTGAFATESDLQAVLLDIKGLYINAEWRTGPDATFLDNVHTVPEPSTFALLALAAVGLSACAWRKRRAA